MSKSAFGLQADDYRPERPPIRFEIRATGWDDTGTRKDLAMIEPGGTMTKALTDDEMRELAATLLTHLGESFMFPNTLEAEVIRAAGAWLDRAEVIRAAGAWLDRAEKPAAGTPSLHKTISGYYNDLRDAVKDYRAGVSTK